MASIEDIQIQVAQQHLEKCGGFALDKGTALLKVAYVPKDGKATGEKGEVRLVTFPATDVEKALEFLDKNCLIKRDDTIYTTGMLAEKSVKQLETLKIRQTNLTKWQCYARGFAYLSKHFEPEAYLEQGSADHRYRKEVDAFKTLFGSFSEAGEYKMELHMDALDELPDDMYKKSLLIQKSTRACAFPCLLVVTGSRNAFMKVNEDGSFKTIDMSNGYSTPFKVMGSVLSASKTFEELTKLTEEGDASKVDIGWGDYQDSMSTSDDVYSKVFKDDPLGDPLFCFGKAPGKTRDDFRPGDMSKALLQVFATDLAQATVGAAITAGINDVIFCGSFVRTKSAKQLLANWFMKKKVYRIGLVNKGQNLNAHFLRHGTHVGALGGLMSHIEA